MTPAAYKDLVIAYKNASPVRLSDVGTVVAGVENNRVAPDGTTAIRRWCSTSSASPAPTSSRRWRAIKEALPALQRAIPAAVAMTVVVDRTETIRASVNDVQFTLVLSIGLVVFVIFLFLRSARATLIPASHCRCR